MSSLRFFLLFLILLSLSLSEDFENSSLWTASTRLMAYSEPRIVIIQKNIQVICASPSCTYSWSVGQSSKDAILMVISMAFKLLSQLKTGSVYTHELPLMHPPTGKVVGSKHEVPSSQGHPVKMSGEPLASHLQDTRCGVRDVVRCSAVP